MNMKDSFALQCLFVVALSLGGLILLECVICWVHDLIYIPILIWWDERCRKTDTQEKE
jgi:hypothetical protein